MTGIKKIERGESAKIKVGRGIEILANAAKVTLGPGGRPAIVEQDFGPPKITKDGISVIKGIRLKDPFENVGAQLVTEVSSKTNDEAGDGTTSSIVFSKALYEEGLKNIRTGSNAVQIKEAINEAVERVVTYLEKHRKKVVSQKDIEHVAIIAANNDPKIGGKISEAIQAVGKDGVVSIEEARGTTTELDTVEGMQLDNGYLSPYFITNNERRSVVLDKPLILITDKKISALAELVPILEAVTQSGRSLLIVADDLEGEALATLILNKIRGVLKVAAIKAPGYGDRKKAILEDLAILTGGTVISEERGYKLENTSLDALGKCGRVTINKEATLIVDGKGGTDKIKARIQEIKHMIEHTTSSYDKEKLQERQAKLAGGVAVIRFGANSQTEMNEMKDRGDDSLAATRAALEEGILPGAGVSYLRAATFLEGEIKSCKNSTQKIGFEIVQNALRACIKTILENALGDNYHHIIHQVEHHKTFEFGYDARNHRFDSLYKMGIIDPFKVIRLVLQNSASAVGTLLTAEVIIVNDPEEKAETPAPRPMGGGMGGMM